MLSQTNQNANNNNTLERSRRARQNWKVVPTDIVRPMRATMNGTRPSSKKQKERNAMVNGQVNKKATLDPSNLVNAAALLGSIGSLKAAEKTEKVVYSPPEQELYEGFPFPFENLVFEGGGNKGMAYVGALQILEEAGIMKNIQRVAGASVGAIIATLIALDFTAEDLKEFLEQDLRRILVDHSCGYCSLLPNLLKGFGWNPGKKMLKWFGEQLKERTGDADVTFKEVQERFGKELCIVVTNLSQMAVEYFHPKTTPNTPIRRAVRMSVALPGVFQCVREMNSDYEDVYVDGGLLCNYPIHAFDGWWLSMDPKDTFFKKLQPLEDFARLFEKSERFGTWNNATLGIILYSHTETELMKTLLSEREGNKPPRPPNTKIARQRLKMQQQQAMMHSEHQAMVQAVGRFMKELQRNNLDEDSIINIQELKGAFRTPKDFTKQDAELLFGQDADYKTAFEELDTDEDGEITFQELMSFIERKGVNLQTRFLGYSRKDIRHLGEFISTLQTALSVNVKRVYVEKKDVERTIGIDTDYIETTDFNLEPEDKAFLIESGKRATRAFLREYVSKNYAKQMYSAAELSDSDEKPQIRPVQPVQPMQPVQPIAVTPDELNKNSETIDLGESRRSGTFRLPPLASAGIRQSSARSDSGESVRSTRKVSLDIQKSPRVKHRTAKVYSESNLRK